MTEQKKYLTDKDRQKLNSLFMELNEAYLLMSEREKGRVEGIVEEIRNQAIIKRSA